MLGRLVALALSSIAAMSAPMAADANRSPIRVTLTAQNHQPHPSKSPAWHWSYCVGITSASGGSVASTTTLLLQILEGGSRAKGVALVTLNRGYPKNDHRWCAAIGGEDNVFDGAPRGKPLVFQAVVTAMGVTVKRDWPIVVR